MFLFFLLRTYLRSLHCNSTGFRKARMSICAVVFKVHFLCTHLRVLLNPLWTLHSNYLCCYQSSASLFITSFCFVVLIRDTVVFSSIQGKKATSFPALSNKLSDQNEVENRVVVDGNLITSRGPGTTIEFALVIVEKLFGRKLALELAKTTVFTSS